MRMLSLVVVLISTVLLSVQGQKNSSDSVVEVKYSKSRNTEFEYLIGGGKWFIPHNAGINIRFKKDSTFVFNDFNTKIMESEVLHGTFELIGNQLILKYNDRPKQTFKFERGKGADDDNYYITKGKKYYFVRSDIDF